MGAIHLQEVTKAFSNAKDAVSDLSLEIADGEFLVLVGPSGCGKSTLLRMIAGIESVSSGRILINDRDATRLLPRDRDIAMVFQSYALYPHMSVLENLSFGLRLAKVPKVERARRVEEVMRMLRLEELGSRRPAQLSGGQRQRVAMGRAMVREPAAFLMDEPLSNLDAKLRVAMRAELARLHDRLGVTTIYVTHDQVEAMTLGERVAVLRGGVLQQVDTSQRLYHHPKNVFVAAFIGSPTINLVEASVDQGELLFGGHRLPVPEGLLPAGDRFIVGIRPTDFRVAGGEDPAPRLSVQVEVAENLGAEVHLLFPVDVPAVDVDGAEPAAGRIHGADEKLIADEGRVMFTAVLAARQQFSVGERVELAVDVGGLLFFDAATGEALERRPSGCMTIPVRA